MTAPPAPHKRNPNKPPTPISSMQSKNLSEGFQREWEEYLKKQGHKAGGSQAIRYVVQFGCGDVGVSEPLLGLGNTRTVVRRICSGRGGGPVCVSNEVHERPIRPTERVPCAANLLTNRGAI